MKTDNVQITILTERPFVRSDEVSELDIVIEINTEVGESAVQGSKALNLCVVIDRSGSMAGNKLETAKFDFSLFGKPNRRN